MGEFGRLLHRSVFMEMVSMDTLIIKIMNFAQQLVDADRASLFLVDSKTNQLYARIFDVQGRRHRRKKAAVAAAAAATKMEITLEGSEEGEEFDEDEEDDEVKLAEETDLDVAREIR